MSTERDPRIQCPIVHDNGKRCQNEASVEYHLRAYLPTHKTSIETYICEECFRAGLKRSKG